MNEEPIAGPRSSSTVQYRYKETVSTFVDSRRDKMFGLTEIAALTGSCLILALVLLSYVYFWVPARSRLASLQADRAQLQTNLATLDGVVSKGRDTKQTVEKIGTSLNEFQTRNLMRQDQGRLALYDELNQLIVKNGVRNTSGPAYAALDPAGTKVTPGKSMNTKWQSFYPGIAVMVTVEGQYQNVRRFIQDIERSKQFVVINQVELQRATESNTPSSSESGAGSRGSLVSLQLNLATYFQRDSAESNAGLGQ
jgi:Tfp pilus assembly protein PilO